MGALYSGPYIYIYISGPIRRAPIYLFALRVASRGLGVRRRTVHTVYAKATGPRGANVSPVRRGTKRRQARALLGGLALGPTLMDGLACMARAHLRPPGLQANTAPTQLARCTEQLCEHGTSRGAMGHSTTRTPHRAHATVLGQNLIHYAHAKPLRTR